MKHEKYQIAGGNIGDLYLAGENLTVGKRQGGGNADRRFAAETVYKMAKVLSVPMELLVSASIQHSERERAYEYGLPEYLQHDLDAYKEGLKNHSELLDCLWGELYGSINVAEINDEAITKEHADFLRGKYLFGGNNDKKG